jgi:alpha-mannosidase
VSVTPDTVLVTAVKKAEDGNGLILRFYDWAGKDGTVQLNIPPGATSATVANLLEKPEGAPLPLLNGRQVTVPVHPFEIQTIEVSYPNRAGLLP